MNKGSAPPLMAMPMTGTGRFALLLAVLGAAPAAAAEPAAPAKTLEAEYVITWLGLPVYSARFTLIWNERRYRMRFRAEAEGLLRLAANTTTVDWRSEGRMANGKVVPERFAQANTFRRQTRRVLVAYAGNGSPSVSVVPPESPGKRPPVPEPLRAGTLDPLSAAFAAVVSSPAAQTCAYSAKVFEGLRRTDVRLKHAGKEPTPVDWISGLERQALVCLMHANRLAGYEEKHLREHPDPLPPATLWVAKHGQAALWLVARLRFESRFGPIYARLTRLKVSAGGKL